MHNPDIEKFDSFLQQQLNHVEVDQSMAEAHMNQMNFPVAVEAAPSISLWQRIMGNKKFLWWSIGLITTTVVVIVLWNNKETNSIPSEKNATTHDASATTPQNNNEIKTDNKTATIVPANTNTNSTTQNNLTTNANQNSSSTAGTKSSSTESQAKNIATTNTKEVNDKKPVINNSITAPAVNTLQNTKADASKEIAKADTALKKPDAKKVATPKDSTFIIW